MIHAEKENEAMAKQESLDRVAQLGAACGCSVKREEPMKQHVTMRVGGPADLFLRVPTEEALRKVLLCCREEGLPYYLVGRGSNLLVSDRGIEGEIGRASCRERV